MTRADTCLLCIDLSYQSYRASAAHPLLTSGRHFTGGLYGFLSSMAKAIRDVDATHIVVGKDSRPYLRSRDYPDYKELRKGRADEDLKKRHKESMVLIEKVLRELGAPIWEVPGFEFDDLCAHVVMQHRSRWGRIVAASNDSDLFQLLWAPNFSMYAKDKQSMWTLQRLREVHGLEPHEYMHATALTGTHNDIEGIRGVGLVTATKALRDASVMRKYRATHADVIDRNLALIRLPHPEFPLRESIPRHSRIYDNRKFYGVLSDYDIDATGAMVDSFGKVLR